MSYAYHYNTQSQADTAASLEPSATVVQGPWLRALETYEIVAGVEVIATPATYTKAWLVLSATEIAGQKSAEVALYGWNGFS